MKSTLFITCTFLALQGMVAPASGRGFCNVDHYGDDRNREEARSAAAQFYGGAAKLMLALAAFEQNEGDEMQSSGKQAVADLLGSADTYAAAAELYQINPGEGVVAFSTLDSSAVAAMASADQGVTASLHSGQVSPDTLLARCGEEAEKMAVAIEVFLSQSSEELRSEDFSDLLKQLSAALTFGRVVSASFAYASGERPEK